MAQYLAIVAYRGLIAGVPSGSLDVQVRWYNVANENAVRERIAAEPIHDYKNHDGETVTWELIEVLEVEEFSPKESGDEVIGFITSADELAELK